MRNYIGSSGFSYKDWRGRFYPEDLKANNWLSFYSRHFPTVEINSSFYHMPSERAFINWRENTPGDFIFSVKGSRFITHIKRLKGVGESIETFTSRARNLKEKLGIILYQLPPGLKKDSKRLEEFIKLLPADIKHAIEFRHESWLEDDIFELLSEHKIAYCIVSACEKKCILKATAPFIYVRFHGLCGQMYSYDYTEDDLKWWADRIFEFNGQNLPVYAYFNNDYAAYAVKNATRLGELI